MDMDIDDNDYLEIIEDKMQEYLLAKLEEVKLQNEALQDELNDKQKELTQSTLHDSNCLEISNVWKRILNHKCVVGFGINSPKSIKNINVILNDENGQHLTYTIKIFNSFNEGMQNQDSPNCWKKYALISNAIQKFDGNIFGNGKHVFLTVCFDLPQFLQKHIYVVNGNIQCTTKSKVFNIKFPEVAISVANDLLHHSESYKDNSLATLLTSVSCYFERDWNLRTIEIPIDFRKAIQALCSLTYVPFGSTGYFLSDKTPLYGHLSIVILNEYKFEKYNILNFKIFTETRKQYILLSHVIFQCMKQVLGENPSTPHIYDLPLQSEHDAERKLDEIKADLKNEIQNLFGFYEINSFSVSRLQLNNTESKLDSTYVQTLGDRCL